MNGKFGPVNKKMIILLQFLYILVFLFLVWEDYLRVGHFQWVDPGAMDDQEELFVNPISVVCILSGLITVLHLFTGSSLRNKRIFSLLHRYIFRPVSFLYAVYCVAMGLIFFVIISSAAVMGAFGSFQDLLNFLLVLLCIIVYVLMGILTLKYLGQSA
jgi:hypothetical protein